MCNLQQFQELKSVDNNFSEIKTAIVSMMPFLFNGKTQLFYIY